MGRQRLGPSIWVSLNTIALAVLICTTALVSLYVVVYSRAALHSDSALKSVLATIALEEHRLVPYGWTFANGDTLLVTPYTLLVPLQRIFGMSFATNATATLICFLGMLCAAYYLARVISPGPRTQAFTACALTACMLSAANLEFIAAQGAYSLYTALSLPLFALLLRPPAGIWKWSPAVLAFALSANNPVRAWVAVFAPAALALAMTWLTSKRGRRAGIHDDLAVLSPLATLGLGAITGHLVYALIIAPAMQNFDAVARMTPASIEHMLFVARQLPHDWFTYFQIDGAWASISIAGRILQMCVWLVSCAIIIAPAIALLSSRFPKELKYAAWLVYALLASGLAPLVLLDGLYQGSMEIRYATLGILVGLVMVPAVVYQMFGEQRRPLFAWITGSLLAISMATSWAWQFKTDPTKPDVHGVSLQQRTALIDMLRKQRVGTAVATYWNSHVLSVLSSGATMVSPVTYNNRLAPFVHHVPNQPPHGTAGSLEAVILDDAELSWDDGAAIVDQLGEPKTRLKANGFNLWIYDRSIVTRIFAVGHRFDMPVPATTVSIESSAAAPACTADDCVVRLHVKNTGQRALATAGKVPMRMGLRGLGRDGKMVADLGRIDFQVPLHPGESDDLVSRVGKLPDGVVDVEACLLQEQVQWLCEKTSRVSDPSIIMLDKPVNPVLVAIVLSGAGLSTCAPAANATCRAELTVRNVGKVALNGPGSKPLVIGYRAHRPPSLGGGVVEGRVGLPYPLVPGAEMTVPVILEAGSARLDFQVCVLQEHVAWLCERTRTRTGAAIPAGAR